MNKKSLPEKNIKSVQLDLFSEFVTNNKDQVSNTVELWENIPKYFFTPSQLRKLRLPTGHADPYIFNYVYDGIPCRVKIQPALLRQKDDSYKAFFPSVTEELIEEILKKILADQRYAIHDTQKSETWVKFTLSMICKELKARGKTRNRQQIKQALEVMSSCILTYYQDDREVWRGSILQDLITVNRKEYESNPNIYHVARLPIFISNSINNLDYRQFNVDRLMSSDEQLTRWIYKKLIHKFTHADYMNHYHFMYSGLKSSGLLQQSREIDNRAKVISSLKELKSLLILSQFEIEERREGRKIIDVKYKIFPSPEFIQEQKASNKRSRENIEKITNQSSHPVDNSSRR